MESLDNLSPNISIRESYMEAKVVSPQTETANPCQKPCQKPCEQRADNGEYYGVLLWLIAIFLAPVVAWFVLASFYTNAFKVQNPCTNECVVDSARLFGASILAGWIVLIFFWLFLWAFSSSWEC